jgi:hypothetical protein
MEILLTNERLSIDFGKYMVSEDRTNLVKNNAGFEPESIEERLQQVTHADVCNWQLKLKNEH